MSNIPGQETSIFLIRQPCLWSGGVQPWAGNYPTSSSRWKWWVKHRQQYDVTIWNVRALCCRLWRGLNWIVPVCHSITGNELVPPLHEVLFYPMAGAEVTMTSHCCCYLSFWVPLEVRYDIWKRCVVPFKMVYILISFMVALTWAYYPFLASISTIDLDWCFEPSQVVYYLPFFASWRPKKLICRSSNAHDNES